MKHSVHLIDDSKFVNSHSFLGNGLLIPAFNCTDTVRAQMFCSEVEQAIQIANGQPPLVYTRFEGEFSKYSSGYLKLKGTWKVLTKIVKNKYNYALIIKKLKLSEEELKHPDEIEYEVGTFHVVFRTEAVNLTEKYGYRYKNEVIDGLKKDDIIDDEILYRDYNRDDEMNFTYGRNLMSVYMPYKGLTTEDGIVISDIAAKKLSSYFVHNVTVSLNTNDLLTNRYGGKNFYKCFPDIGEETKDTILCCMRRMAYKDNPFKLVKMNNHLPEDIDRPVDGTVIDIKVICNIPEDKFDEEMNKPYNKQIYKYYLEEREYYNNFVKYLTNIINTRGSKISDDLIHYYNRFKMLSDPKVKFRLDDNLFDHIVLKFTVLVKHPVTEGSKLAGRYGNRHIVGLIMY